VAAGAPAGRLSLHPMWRHHSGLGTPQHIWAEIFQSSKQILDLDCFFCKHPSMNCCNLS
jgi:hypothetical protein